MTYWPKAYFGPIQSLLEIVVLVETDSAAIGVNVAVEQVITVRVVAEETDVAALMEIE